MKTGHYVRSITLHVWIILSASAFQASPVSGRGGFSSFAPLARSQETKLNAFFTTVASTLDTFWMTSPYAAAAITCGIKASAADAVAQKRQYRKRDGSIAASKSTDWKRNLAFLLYGAMYQGMAQEYIYNHLYPVWFGTGTSIQTVLAKVFFDLLVQTTLVTLPIAYVTKALIFQYSFSEAMKRYTEDILNHGLLTKYFMLWGPVQCITFSIIPEHWRVTFIAFVSFFWLIVLSTIASRTEQQKVLRGGSVSNNSIRAVATVAASTEMRKEVPMECSLVDGQTCNIDG